MSFSSDSVNSATAGCLQRLTCLDQRLTCFDQRLTCLDRRLTGSLTLGSLRCSPVVTSQQMNGENDTVHIGAERGQREENKEAKRDRGTRREEKTEAGRDGSCREKQRQLEGDSCMTRVRLLPVNAVTDQPIRD